MLIKREETEQGLPFFKFLQRAPYSGYPNLLIGDETPEMVETEDAYPGVLFIKQPVWILAKRLDNGSAVLARICSLREREDQNLEGSSQVWPLADVENFEIKQEAMGFGLPDGRKVAMILVLLALRSGKRAVMACHTGEHFLGVLQLQDELQRSFIPLRDQERAAAQAQPAAQPGPADAARSAQEDAPEQPAAGKPAGQPAQAATAPHGPPPLGRQPASGNWMLVLIGGAVAFSVLLCGIAYLNQRAEQERAELEEKQGEPIRHYVNTGEFLHAIIDVLEPYCGPKGCPNAKVREGAPYTWELVRPTGGLRILVRPTFDKVTGARTAALELDFATMREDGDVARDIPQLAEIGDKLMRLLKFPAAYLQATCGAPGSVEGRSFRCVSSRYDPDFGPFDQNYTPQARAFLGQKVFTMTAPGPFYYQREGTRQMHYATTPPWQRPASR